MALDGFIFDVDGTLADTNPAHVRAWQKAFESCGYKVAPDRIAVEIGKGGDKLVAAILGQSGEDKDGDALREAYGHAFLDIAERENFRVFDGAVELLQELRNRGLKTAIATSADRPYFDAIQKSCGVRLEDYVDLVTTKSDAAQSKPAPDLVLATCEKLGLSPAQCAMLGDTPYDAQSCKHSGVVCLGVLSGGFDESELINAGARHFWKDIHELLQNLDSVLEIASPATISLTTEIQEQLMHAALHEARIGMQNGEAPIGCVLANGDGHIIARGHNTMNASQNKIAHAEIVTFEHAAGKIPLDARDLILVSTLEPCVMCTGAAMEAAVDTILFALRAPADNGSTRVYPPGSPESQMPRIVGGVLEDESRALFEEWLQKDLPEQQRKFGEQLLKLA